jgi:hypothetical protein
MSRAEDHSSQAATFRLSLHQESGCVIWCSCSKSRVGPSVISLHETATGRQRYFGCGIAKYNPVLVEHIEPTGTRASRRVRT